MASDDTDSESDYIPCSQPVLGKIILESPEHSDEETNHVQLTKKGNIRKRQTYNISLKDRKRQKREEKIFNKYFVKPGCHENVCKKNVRRAFQRSIAKQ